MNTVINEILDMLADDIISHGFFAQCLKQEVTDPPPSDEYLQDILKQLLISGDVEIGFAKSKTPDYVEFVAWNGTAEERVSRAMTVLASVNGPDKEFAYWLCLPKNVDRFEGHDE